MEKNMKTKGVLSVVLASFLYGIMPIFTKMALREGLSNSAYVFNRFFMAAVFSLLLCIMTKRNMKVSPTRLLQMTVIGIIGYGLTGMFLTISYTRIPVGLATMFHFTNPMIITVAMIVIFKDKPTKFKIISTVVALLGLFLMADFSRLDFLGVVYAMLSGVTYAVYVIANKKSELRNIDNFVVVFYISAINTVFFGVKNVVGGEFAFCPTLKSWLLLAFIGLFCTVAALALLTYGIRVLGASNAAMINLLEPIISLISGVIVYGDIISAKAMCGCAAVVIAGVLTAMDSGKE